MDEIDVSTTAVAQNRIEMCMYIDARKKEMRRSLQTSFTGLKRINNLIIKLEVQLVRSVCDGTTHACAAVVL